MLTSDRNTGQALCSFNQTKLVGRWASLIAAVHLQSSEEFMILGNYAFRTKNIQTKKRCVCGNCARFAGIFRRQANERNHVANLAIEGNADSIQHSRKGR